MKQIVKCKFIALGISIAFMACNNSDKKAADTSTGGDTAAKSTIRTNNKPTVKEQDMDAAKVAPGLYKVAKDTMGIRVLEINYKPGDSSAMHSHPDNALYVIDGGKGEFTEKDGTKHVNELKSGMTNIQAGGTHSVKNVGTTTLKAILVETNRPDKAGTVQDAAMDAVKVAPTLYKTMNDTMNMRVVMATYKPGASSAMHFHPDYAVYVVEGGKATFTEKDGTKRENAMEKGTIMILPGGTHSVKNTGNTTLKVLLVEVNRPVN